MNFEFKRSIIAGSESELPSISLPPSHVLPVSSFWPVHLVGDGFSCLTMKNTKIGLDCACASLSACDAFVRQLILCHSCRLSRAKFVSIASRIFLGWLLHAAVEQLWALTDDMVTNRQAVSRVISFAKSFIKIPCSWVH